MPSLRIISLLATMACAVFSNAAPTTSTPAEISNFGNAVGNTVADTRGLYRRDTDLPGVPDDIAQGYTEAVGDAAGTPSRRDDQAQSIPIILVRVTNQIIPVVQQISRWSSRLDFLDSYPFVATRGHRHGRRPD